jgi:hypothetical protein
MCVSMYVCIYGSVQTYPRMKFDVKQQVEKNLKPKLQKENKRKRCLMPLKSLRIKFSKTSLIRIYYVFLAKLHKIFMLHIIMKTSESKKKTESICIM